MLDNILDDMETKKGIQTSKAEVQRPKTANEPLWSANRKLVDEDEFEPFDELAFDESPPSHLKKVEAHQRSNDEIRERKKNLFGGNQQSDQTLPSAPKNVLATGNVNSRHKNAVSTGFDDFNAQRPFTANTGNAQPQFAANSIFSGQGSLDSGIDVIETGFSRQKKRVM